VHLHWPLAVGNRNVLERRSASGRSNESSSIATTDSLVVELIGEWAFTNLKVAEQFKEIAA
jgi:hypothetical protein